MKSVGVECFKAEATAKAAGMLHSMYDVWQVACETLKVYQH